MSAEMRSAVLGDGAPLESAGVTQLLARAPVALALLRGPELVLELANPLFVKQLTGPDGVGRPLRESLAGRLWEGLLEVLDSAFRSGASVHLPERQLRSDPPGNGAPEEAWFTTNIEPLREQDGRVSGLIVALTEVKVTEQKRAEEERERAEEKLRLLAAASDRLAQSLEYRTTLAAMAQLAVPLLADWVLIDLLDDRGRRERVAVAYADPAKAPIAELIRGFPAGDDDRPTSQGLRAGGPILIEEVDLEQVMQALPDPAFGRAVQAIGARSCLVVPLIARGRRVGVLTFISAESGRRYSEADRGLGEELGRRAALSIDNARLYEAAERDRLRAEEANRAKDEFLAMVSHELRTPLTAILGYSSMLRAGGGSQQVRDRALEVIDRNARAQAQLINDLLDISRIITGKLRLNVRPADLHGVVEGALESVQPAAEAKEVRIARVLDPAAGPVFGDPERLQQVVWNLVANAVKFTPRGGKVTVGLAQVNSHAEIVVSDTGPGITADFLPHVFERFRQADPSSSRYHGGLGLGLSIVKHLVDLHGGTVEARSGGEAKGATFIVKLPIASPRPDSAVAPAVNSDVGEALPFTNPAELQGARILLVEDEEDSRVLLASLLQACQAEVTSVASASEALSALERERFDALVSDLGLPGEDGFALIRKLRQRPAEQGGRIPAIALTAYARDEDRTRSLESGFNLHLAKPIEAAELASVLASVVRRDRPASG